MAWANRGKSLNLFSWWGVLLLSIAAGLLVGGLVALFWPSTYTATSSFFVSDPAELLSTMLQDAPSIPGEAGVSKLKPTQDRLAAILSSHMLRAKLAQKYGLADKLGLEPMEAEEALARMAKIQAIGTEGFSIAVTCKGYSGLRVAVSHTLRYDEARTLCAALANDYLSELQQYITDTAVKDATKRREFIQTVQANVLRQLGTAQSGLERLQRSHALLDPESKVALVSDRVRALQAAYATARAKVDETQSSLHKAQGQMSRVDVMRVSSEVEMRNPIIGQLEQRISELQMQIAAQEAQGKTRQHRDVAELLSALQSSQEQLKRLGEDVHKEVARGANPTYDKVVGQVVDLQVALAGARASCQRTQSMLRSAEGELAELPPVAREFAALKQDQDIQFQALAALKQSLAVALVQEQQSKHVGEFRVLDEAVEPADLNRPPVLLSMLLTAGTILAVMGVVVLNRMIFGS